MADINTVTTIFSTITLDNNWVTLDMGTNSSGYLVANKSSSEVGATFSNKNVSKIVVEFGVESGLGNSYPLIIRTVVLDFNVSCGDPSYDKNLAAVDMRHLPAKMYVRVKSIDAGYKERHYANTGSTEQCNIFIGMSKVDIS